MPARSRARATWAMLALPVLVVGALLGLYGRDFGTKVVGSHPGSAIERQHDTSAVLQAHVRAEADQGVGGRSTKLRAMLLVAVAAAAMGAAVTLLAWFVHCFERRSLRAFSQSAWLALRGPPSCA